MTNCQSTLCMTLGHKAVIVLRSDCLAPTGGTRQPRAADICGRRNELTDVGSLETHTHRRSWLQDSTLTQKWHFYLSLRVFLTVKIVG